MHGCKSFSFPEPIITNIKLKNFLDNDVCEKYYLSSDICEYDNGNMYIANKNTNKLIYEYKTGGWCGKDHSTKFFQSSRLYSENGFAPTLTHSNLVNNCKLVTNNKMIRIRKLSPNEALRLMGFDDLDFDKASKVCRETALYEQAGNLMVVNVIYYILKELLIE